MKWARLGLGSPRARHLQVLHLLAAGPAPSVESLSDPRGSICSDLLYLIVVRPVLFCFVFLTFVWLTFYPFTSSLRTCETEQTPPVRNGVGPHFPRSLRQAVSSAVARTTRAPGAHRCAGARSRHLTSVSVCSLCSLSQVFSCLLAVCWTVF